MGGATDVLATLKCYISCSRLLSIYEYSDDKHQKCKWYTPLVHRIHQGDLYCVNDVFSWYTHKCDFICAHKKSMAFLVPFLMKLTDA